MLFGLFLSQEFLDCYFINQQQTQNKLWLYVYENSNSFEEFLLKCTAEIEDADGKRSFAYNQFDYISDENGEIIVDFVGRYENYIHDVQILCKKLGLDEIELPHIWASKSKHYSYYYNETCKQIVAERFAKDIEYFGYRFESEF